MYSNTFYDEILTSCAPILEERRFAARTVIHQTGRDCHYLFFVREGALRAFYHLNDREITTHFATPGFSMTAPDSFIAARPSKYGLAAIVPTVTYAIERGRLEDLLRRRPELERLARRFTQALYLELLDRSESFAFLSAAERYAKLLREQPEVLRVAPLHQVSSYLGVRPETISRVRAAAGGVS